MAGFMVLWSIVTLLAYKARNFTDMLVLRFFLGVLEAPVSAKEQPKKCVL
jgi:hypothetical protein